MLQYATIHWLDLNQILLRGPVLEVFQQFRIFTHGSGQGFQALLLKRKLCAKVQSGQAILRVQQKLLLRNTTAADAQVIEHRSHCLNNAPIWLSSCPWAKQTVLFLTCRTMVFFSLFFSPEMTRSESHSHRLEVYWLPDQRAFSSIGDHFHKDTQKHVEHHEGGNDYEDLHKTAKIGQELAECWENRAADNENCEHDEFSASEDKVNNNKKCQNITVSMRKPMSLWQCLKSMRTRLWRIMLQQYVTSSSNVPMIISENLKIQMRNKSIQKPSNTKHFAVLHVHYHPLSSELSSVFSLCFHASTCPRIWRTLAQVAEETFNLHTICTPMVSQRMSFSRCTLRSGPSLQLPGEAGIWRFVFFMILHLFPVVMKEKRKRSAFRQIMRSWSVANPWW